MQLGLYSEILLGLGKRQCNPHSANAISQLILQFGCSLAQMTCEPGAEAAGAAGVSSIEVKSEWQHLAAEGDDLERRFGG